MKEVSVYEIVLLIVKFYWDALVAQPISIFYLGVQLLAIIGFFVVMHRYSCKQRKYQPAHPTHSRPEDAADTN